MWILSAGGTTRPRARSARRRRRENRSRICATHAVSSIASLTAKLVRPSAEACSANQRPTPPAAAPQRTSPGIFGCLPRTHWYGLYPLALMSACPASTAALMAIFSVRSSATACCLHTQKRSALKVPPPRSAMPFCQGASTGIVRYRQDRLSHHPANSSEVNSGPTSATQVTGDPPL